MSDRHETIVNVEREPDQNVVHADRGREVGLAVGVVVAVVLVGLVLFAVIKTTGTEAGPELAERDRAGSGAATQPRIPGTPRAKSVVSTPASAASEPDRYDISQSCGPGEELAALPAIPESSG